MVHEVRSCTALAVNAIDALHLGEIPANRAVSTLSRSSESSALTAQCVSILPTRMTTPREHDKDGGADKRTFGSVWKGDMEEEYEGERRLTREIQQHYREFPGFLHFASVKRGRVSLAL